MDKLVQMIQDRTGIGEDKARTAAETAIDFLKDRLPDPIASQIDDVVSGESSNDDSPMGSVGKMFGS